MQITTRILFLLVIGLLSLSNRTALGQEPGELNLRDLNSGDLNSIELHVTDMDGKAISGARASVLLWDGAWKELPIRGETDKEGKATLAGLPSDKYVAVIVKAAGFAPTCASSELAKQEKRSLNLKLAKPVTSKISMGISVERNIPQIDSDG